MVKKLKKKTQPVKRAVRGPRRAVKIAGALLTARDVADQMGVELKTVHNWAESGDLPHIRTPGRHLRFSPEVIAKFLAEYGMRGSAAADAAGVPGLHKAQSYFLGKKSTFNRCHEQLPTGSWEQTSDPYEVLVVAAEPDKIQICIEQDATRHLEEKQFIKAVAALSHVSVFWIGSGKPPSAEATKLTLS